MAHRDVEKNTRQHIRVRSSDFSDLELIDVRTIAIDSRDGSEIPTRKGVSLQVDRIPDLIDALLWSIVQIPDENGDAEEIGLPKRAELEPMLVEIERVLNEHGTPLHWDSLEKMLVSNEDQSGRDKRLLRYTLLAHPERITHVGDSVFSLNKT